MPHDTMIPSVLYDHVIHANHIHWCDLEANSLATCEERAHAEHALRWAGDVLSFAAILVLLLVLLRPVGRALANSRPGELVFMIPARRTTASAIFEGGVR